MVLKSLITRQNKKILVGSGLIGVLFLAWLLFSPASQKLRIQSVTVFCLAGLPENEFAPLVDHAFALTEQGRADSVKLDEYGNLMVAAPLETIELLHERFRNKLDELTKGKRFEKVDVEQLNSMISEHQRRTGLDIPPELKIQFAEQCRVTTSTSTK